MAEGVFEKMTIGMVAITIVIFGLIMYATSIFDAYGINEPKINSFDFVDKVNTLNNTLSTMYNTSQGGFDVLGLGFVLSSGWSMIGLIFSIITLFITLPMHLVALTVPDNTTAMWLGPLLEVIYLAIIVFTTLNILLSRREGSV